MSLKKAIMITSCTGWTVLGFNRGINSYDYHYNQCKKYNSKNYFYTTRIICGIGSSFIYINPVCIPLLICKEIYRLEVNLREMEDEKQSEFYNSIL